MGGEWATGVALVSETFPARHRGKALAFVQSSWAIGYGLAAAVNLVVMPIWGWRGVFFVGVLPALFTIWIRRKVEEPEMWHRTAPEARGRISALFTPGIARTTVFITLMNACTLFGWWGLNLWVPAYLNLPVERGGIGLSSSAMSWFVIAMQVGMWFGYISFGYIADAIGRKRAYVIFVLMASLLLPLYGVLREPALLLVLGPFVAFFGTGYYSGFGAVIAELYPTSVRATAAGVCYNVGRIASAAAPFVVGLDGRHARLRRGVRDHRRGVPAGRGDVDRHSGDAEPRAAGELAIERATSGFEEGKTAPAPGSMVEVRCAHATSIHWVPALQRPDDRHPHRARNSAPGVGAGVHQSVHRLQLWRRCGLPSGHPV